MDAPLRSLLSKRDTLTLLELIHASLACEREEKLKALILGMRSLLPFDFAVCSLVGMEDGAMTDQCDVVNVSYPAEWLDLYFKRDFHLIDPIIKENFNNFGVQYWSDTYRKHGGPEWFIALAEDHDLKRGYTCGMMDRTQKKASLFSLAGETPDHPRHRLVLDMLAPHLHQALSRVSRGERMRPVSALSAREREVLIWIREGKSSWEISVILGLSERTVKFHVAGIMQKLNASSRSHAVAIAMSAGVI